MFTEWYLTHGTGTNCVYAYPAELTGIRKYRGCYFYAPTHDLSPYPGKGEEASHWGMGLSRRASKKIFGHTPKKGELLKVTKTKRGWVAEKIDLEFSD